MKPETAEWLKIADHDIAGAASLLEDRLWPGAARSRYPGAEYNEEEIRKLFEETKRLFEWLRARLS